MIKLKNILNEACWTGYKQVGMKKKGDRQVPNCVPVNEDEDYDELDVEDEDEEDFINFLKGYTTEINEAGMNPVKKVVNAILKKHNVQAMKTYASSVRGAHNIINGGYRWEGDWHLGFYGNVPQDVVEKVAAEMEKAGVKYVKVKKGHISADFSKTGLNEAKSSVNEAEYQGREVKLGKPMQGDVKKFKVYVKNPQGKVIKVNFGHGGTSAAAAGEETMRIRKSNPDARKAFRARHNCDEPGPRTKARYWSCKKW